MKPARIAVLVSAGRHPVSGAPRYSCNDGIALSTGLALARSTSAAIDVLHAGDPDNAALPDYLALGAERIEVLRALSGADIVPLLAQRVASVDLVITGSRAENGDDSGLLPYLLAAALGRSVIANVLSIQSTNDGLEVLQFLPKGKRRRILVRQPAVIAVHPLAPAELQYAYARRLAGKVETVDSISTLPNPMGQWQQEPARKPVKLKAREKKAGHDRMLSAIAGESKSGLVVIDGNHVEKAQVVLAYLREHRLIDF